MEYHDRRFEIPHHLTIARGGARLASRLLGTYFVLTGGMGCHLKSAPDAEDLASRAFLVEGKVRVIPESSPLRGRLKVISVSSTTVQRHLNVPATVRADPARFANVAPPLSGRVTSVYVSLGDAVTKGQALFSLDSPDLISAQSDYLKAVSARAQAERVLARQKDLREHGIAAQREVEQTQTELDLADRELHRADSRLRLLGSNTNSIGKPMVVRAPIPGRVVEFKIAQGEMLNDLSAAVMTIADLSEVWITANVQEMDVRRVHVGQAASIVLIAYPEQRFEGTVHVVGDLLNSETRTLSVTLVFKNSDRRLRPGMFGTVDFLAEPEKALVVDTSAVVHTGRDNQVFVEVAPWRFEARTVQLDTSMIWEPWEGSQTLRPPTSHPSPLASLGLARECAASKAGRLPTRLDGKAIVLAGLTAGEKVVAQDAVVLQ
jgi:cobalt-zinc-cadmium efflux system membrane fusion protein